MMADGVTITQAATWSIAAFATSGVILRPWGLPEAIWAVIGAAALVLSALLPWQDALAAVSRGTDVYLFLTGMMLLAEVARREGLFDWLAVHATGAAKGSPARLFGLVYLVGIVVTAFLSNDATAVVLTPAVYAACKAAKAKPMPYLVICAFIANAASFVLPISNPANFVLYGNHIPALWPWLRQFALPSVLSIAATYAVLRVLFRSDLRGKIETKVAVSDLSDGGRYAAYGIAATAIALLLASALDTQLGAPTFAAGALTALFVLIEKRETPWKLLHGVSWGVLPLVAGLFVLVQGLSNRRRGATYRLFEVGRFAIGSGHGVDFRNGDRLRRQSHEQPAGGPDRRICGDARASAFGGYGRAPDRRRSRPEPFCHRLACDHPLADRLETRGRNLLRSSVPENRRGRDAARASARARRAHTDKRSVATDCLKRLSAPDRDRQPDRRRPRCQWRAAQAPSRCQVRRAAPAEGSRGSL